MFGTKTEKERRNKENRKNERYWKTLTCVPIINSFADDNDNDNNGDRRREKAEKRN